MSGGSGARPSGSLRRVITECTAGSVHVDQVAAGLRRMINLGDDNPKLDNDLRELVSLCALTNTQAVTYESFASIFKIDDQQDCPLLEGSAVRSSC